MTAAMNFAKTKSLPLFSIISEGPGTGITDRSNSQDWYFVIKSYYYWGEANVTYDPTRCPPYLMDYTFHLEDHYDFSTSLNFLFIPFALANRDPGDLHLAGLAKEYFINGSVTKTDHPF